MLPPIFLWWAAIVFCSCCCGESMKSVWHVPSGKQAVLDDQYFLRASLRFSEGACRITNAPLIPKHRHQLLLYGSRTNWPCIRLMRQWIDSDLAMRAWSRPLWADCLRSVFTRGQQTRSFLTLILHSLFDHDFDFCEFVTDLFLTCDHERENACLTDWVVVTGAALIMCLSSV